MEGTKATSIKIQTRSMLGLGKQAIKPLII